jgi:integrase
VTALREWIALRGASEGPLFRSVGRNRNGRLTNSTINVCIKRALRLAAVDPALYSAHSLRSGMITAAVHNGADLASIMERSGHSSISSLMGYVRRGKLFASDQLKGVL